MIALLLLLAKINFAQDCNTLAANKSSTLVSAKDEISSPTGTTGKWVIKDAGVKAEISGEAGFGNVSVEEKVLEVSLAVNAGFEAGGIVPPILNLK